MMKNVTGQRLNIWSTIPDSRSHALTSTLARMSGSQSCEVIRVVDSYLIDAKLSKNEWGIVRALFSHPLVHANVLGGSPAPEHFLYAIEIGFLPGVTDNLASTVVETIEDSLGRSLKKGEAVYTAKIVYLDGELDRELVSQFAYELHNPLIERAAILSQREYTTQGGFLLRPPRVTLAEETAVKDVSLWCSDDELTLIGKLGILNEDGTRRGPLALSLEALKTIRTHFHALGRLPTDIELESLAQTWSEHCKHSIFADPIDEITEGIYKRYIKGATRDVRAKKGRADFCVSVFTDNAGAIAYDDEYLVTHKVETHNSPSALDPFGGAITGIVGVNRDALGFGLGAKPIANTYGFCVGDPDDTRPLYRDQACTNPLLPPARILDGVVRGVGSGGNESGIPTALGMLCVDDRFRGKPLVFAGTVGLLPRKKGKRALHQKQARAGDYIVVVGGRVGLDGIHGATFSSEALDSGSPATAVQIGDPITQKKMSDAIVKEARDMELYTSITDNGAGGISCSVAEMARECGGCRVELEKVPLKYSGLAPWQIWISESQERMTLAVPPKKWDKLRELLAKRGVEATRIGEFTDSGNCVVAHEGNTIMDLELSFLHDGRPIVFQQTKAPHIETAPAPKTRAGTIDALVLKLLARPSIASTAFIATQYDHEVQGSSVTKSLQGRGQVCTESAVLRPLLDRESGIVLSHGYAPWLSELDAYAMAASAIDNAVAAAVASGADPEQLALLDNFCWCSSHDPERLYQLKEAARACYDVAVAYGTPFISGKDSMFNDFKGFDAQGTPCMISIPPTLLISAIGVIDSVHRAITTDLKQADDCIYLLGDTLDECAGSEYLALVTGKSHVLHEGAQVPRVDVQKNSAVYRAYAQAVGKGYIASGMRVGRGGLAIALAKASIAGMLGMDITLPATTLSSDTYLFSESQGRLLVSVDPKHKTAFEKVCSKVSCTELGTVSEMPRMHITDRRGAEVCVLSLERARRAYRATFKNC